MVIAQEPDMKRAMDFDLEKKFHFDLQLLVRVQQALYLYCNTIPYYEPHP